MKKKQDREDLRELDFIKCYMYEPSKRRLIDTTLSIDRDNCKFLVNTYEDKKISY